MKMKKGLWAVIIICLIFAAAWYRLNSPDTINNKAVQLHASGKTKEAIALLEKVPPSKRNETIQKNLAIFQQEDSQSQEDENLKKHVQERIKRMIAEGWKDDTASFQVTMDAAFASFQVGNNKDAILLYERALFKKPDDLDLEQKIEDIEAMVQAKETGK